MQTGYFRPFTMPFAFSGAKQDPLSGTTTTTATLHLLCTEGMVQVMVMVVEELH